MLPNFLGAINTVTIGLMHASNLGFESLVVALSRTREQRFYCVVNTGGCLQCSADRLDSPSMFYVHRCNELMAGLTVELGRKENRSVFQYGVGATQTLDLTSELLKPSPLVRNDSGMRAGINLSFSNSGSECFRSYTKQL